MRVLFKYTNILIENKILHNSNSNSKTLNARKQAPQKMAFLNIYLTTNQSLFYPSRLISFWTATPPSLWLFYHFKFFMLEALQQ